MKFLILRLLAKRMETADPLFSVHWNQEPNERSAELAFGAILARRTDNAMPNWSTALRLMESPHANFVLHWDHEPIHVTIVTSFWLAKRVRSWRD